MFSISYVPKPDLNPTQKPKPNLMLKSPTHHSLTVYSTGIFQYP